MSTAVLPRSTRANRLKRRSMSRIMVALTYLAAALATLPLVFIVVHIVKLGAGAISIDLFTQMPRPVGEGGGGMANAISGSLILIGIAAAVGVPAGIGAGLYLAEHRQTPLANTVRFLSDVLNGIPSIVMGIFAWQLLVRPVGHFSALSGGVALGAMIIPLVTRTTEEMIRTVPNSLREAALALGYQRWRTSLSVILRTAMPGDRHRSTGRDCEDRGRDGAASLYRIRQSVLVHLTESADRGPAAADLHVRDQSL